MDGVERGVEHQQRDQQQQRQRHQERDGRFALQRPAQSRTPAGADGRRRFQCRIDHASPSRDSVRLRISGSGCPSPGGWEPAAARGGAAPLGPSGERQQHRERNQVRMKPSISLSAQARVFSIGSPCLNRTTILVWIAWV